MKATLAGLLAILIWGTIPALTKNAVMTLPVTFYLILRFSLSLPVFLFLLPKIASRFKQISLLGWLGLLVTLGCNYYFQTLAMDALPASWYVVIFSLNPILALVFMKLRLSVVSWLAIGGAILGTLLFVDLRAFHGTYPMISIVYVTIGMLTWVLYTLQIRRFQIHYSDLETTALTHLVSFVSVLGIWSMNGFARGPLTTANIPEVLVLGLSTPVAYFLFSYCLRRLPVFGVVSQYLEPVFGVIAAYIVCGETLTVLQAVGAAIIIVATSKLSIAH